MDSKPETDVRVGRLEGCRVEGRGLPRLRAISRAGRRHSRMSVLLPEPLTPVTSTRRLSGNCTVRSLRLLAAAWRRVRAFGSFDAGGVARRRPRLTGAVRVRLAPAAPSAG